MFRTEGYLYAVQTLRNAITANTFLASTVLSLFTLAVGYLRQIQQRRFDPIALAQIGGSAFLLLCSAYSFSQSARLMTHAGFMFPVACAPAAAGGADADADRAAGGDGDGPRAALVLTPAAVERVMVKSEHCQWAGLRFLYLAACPVAWVFGGELGFLAACLALRCFLRRIDQPPPNA